MYEKMGIRFLYPENWMLDEEEASSRLVSVTVYSPHGAFWSIVRASHEQRPQALWPPLP